MAELIRTGYKRLFEVKTLHHYFLDDGAEDFQAPFRPEDTELGADSDAEKAQKKERRGKFLNVRQKYLNAFDIRKTLTVQPLTATATLIKQLGGQFRQTATGFLVAVPSEAVVPTEAVFDFTLVIEDSNFYIFTALPFFKADQNEAARAQKIVELVHDDKVYRYKSNVFVLSNKNGATRQPTASVPGDRFYLTKEIPDFAAGANYLAEALVKKGNDLFRAVRDKAQAEPPPSDNWQKLNAWIKDDNQVDNPAFTFDKLPAYLSQEDIPDIVPLPGMKGNPTKGILLTAELPDNLFALVRLEAAPAGAPEAFQLLKAGKLRTPHPVFELHFKNRATVWRFYDYATDKFKEGKLKQPLGLTAFGNASSSKKKPFPPAVVVKTNNTGNLTHMYSDII